MYVEAPIRMSRAKPAPFRAHDPKRVLAVLQR